MSGGFRARDFERSLPLRFGTRAPSRKANELRIAGAASQLWDTFSQTVLATDETISLRMEASRQ